MDGLAWLLLVGIANLGVFIVMGITGASLRFNVNMAVEKMKAVDASLLILSNSVNTLAGALGVQAADLRNHLEYDNGRFKHGGEACQERHESVTAQLASSKQASKERHELTMRLLGEKHDQVMAVLRRERHAGTSS